MNEKLKYTMKIFDSYEKRFVTERLKKEEIFTTDSAHREKLFEKTKRIIGFSEENIPTVSDFEIINEQDYDNFTVYNVRYQTWKNCYVSATLTMPKGEEKVPIVFHFCGHTKRGRHAENYHLFHRRLANMGIATMTPDNIGQGDREFMVHGQAIEPFCCGLTLQGLIVMESVALIRYMQSYPRIDKDRMASCGNSGGGTLNMFLAALAPELAAVASTGYPSEFAHIFSKERKHCACNLLPGCLKNIEMWEIYSLCAPRPLFLSQGHNDDLFPVDLFYRNARKVKTIYSLFSVEQNFESAVTRTKHRWAADDRKLVAEFFAKQFDIQIKDFDESDVNYEDVDVVEFPQNAITTKQLAEQISGKKAPDNITLAEIFVPKLDGEPIDFELTVKDLGRCILSQTFAQMECALTEEW